MRKRLLVSLVVLLVLAAIAIPVSARQWDAKVTGGGQAKAGEIYFSQTVSAWQAGEMYGGQMQYSRENQTVSDLSVHATVECLGIFDEEAIAVAAGPAMVQYDPGNFVGEEQWLVVEIQEGGKGSGDMLRVRLMDEDAAWAVCDGPSGSFPGTVYDGNFTIRDW